MRPSPIARRAPLPKGVPADAVEITASFPRATPARKRFAVWLFVSSVLIAVGSFFGAFLVIVTSGQRDGAGGELALFLFVLGGVVMGLPFLAMFLTGEPIARFNRVYISPERIDICAFGRAATFTPRLYRLTDITQTPLLGVRALRVNQGLHAGYMLVYERDIDLVLARWHGDDPPVISAATAQRGPAGSSWADAGETVDVTLSAKDAGAVLRARGWRIGVTLLGVGVVIVLTLVGVIDGAFLLYIPTAGFALVALGHVIAEFGEPIARVRRVRVGPGRIEVSWFGSEAKPFVHGRAVLRRHGSLAHQRGWMRGTHELVEPGKRRQWLTLTDADARTVERLWNLGRGGTEPETTPLTN